MFKSGFINIIGRPNVGKSSLMNVLVGEKMSIITNKPQTTRHRIKGIVSDADCQMIFSDTPGYIENPKYKMQEVMNQFVKSTFEDSDLILFVVSVDEKYDESDLILNEIKKNNNAEYPVFLIVNKCDKIEQNKLLTLLEWWKSVFEFKEIFPISTINNVGISELLNSIKKYLPEGPKYYPDDQLTDRSERFFVSEIIREQILVKYHQEIPYHCEIAIESFIVQTSPKKIVKIKALIYVSKDSHKNIIIGRGGKDIKQIGIESRKIIENYLDSPVYLELVVKVKENWRDSDLNLKQFGYFA
ncbi:MAG: GTPase Era [Saprospiraceae bacterium]|nr:GTPase Era [Saprospiraceae bacterium]